MKMLRPMLPAIVAALALASRVNAAPAAHGTVFERANFDTTCSPCRDFDQYANGGWKSVHSIPASQSSYGAFSELQDANRQALYDILERAAKDKTAKPGSDTWMLGTYYGSCMDSVAADAAGAKPLQPQLSAIDGMKSIKEFPTQLAWINNHGTRGPFGMGGGQDIKNSDMVIANIIQAGLGLPDREYYFKRDSASVATRAEYVDHVSRSLALAGVAEADAKEQAKQVMMLETALAKVSYTNVQRRDPNANYHKMSVADLQKLTPSFDWATYIAARHAPKFDSINVSQVTFITGFDSILAATPLPAWQAYLRWRVVDDASSTLSSAFVQEDFRFNRVLSGATEMQPRWKRCLAATDGSLGDMLGQAYVHEHFSPEAKQRALRLVHNLEAALNDRLAVLEWMSEPTRQAAKVKLAAFAERIGYPDTWRDYKGVQLTRGSYYANRQSAREHEIARLMSKIGKPTERGEWFMTTPTVNAFYSPQLNSINFPAGILQPPFYDPSWDDAVNYGAIGAVIGHEMTHGFDDQGRQFDPKGNLRDWWVADDASHYKERSTKVSDQFDGYTVLDSLHVNGKLTLGENIADLGGLALAYAALQKELAGKPAPGKIDGFTPEQRFFLAYARIWRRLDRPEALRTQVQTNPHSPGHWRVDGPLSNLEEFAKAFDCKEGDPMVRAQDQRARIW
jgi:putative endopeptidase